MLFWFFLSFFVAISLAQNNNVCKTFTDYATKSVNHNCWHNSDLDAPAEHIINRQGFAFESYPILTKDGYVLSLFRIPHNNTDVGRRRQPVYLFHGFALNSIIWYDHGLRSLAFALSKQGYDVWMANMRGTRYSRTHLNYTSRDLDFWNYSWEEVAYFDVPASLKFIKKMTGQKAIYIGYSMGTTISYVYASVYKKQSKRLLKGIVSLAPVAYLTSPRSFVNILTPLRRPIEVTATVLKLAGLFKYTHLQQRISRIVCDQYPSIYICWALALIFSGHPDPEFGAEDIPLLFSDVPDGVSIYTILHYLQEFHNGGRFQRYDYGPENNLKLYHSKEPPRFNVKNIELCVHLFYGKKDVVAVTKDVNALNETLRCSTVQSLHNGAGAPYTHFDFIYGHSVEITLYPFLFGRLRELVSKD